MPPPIRVLFLGTGGTTPFGLRKMPCIAIKYEGYLIVLDFGEFCQFSLVERKLHPFRSRTYILVSHLHADHVGGLPTFLHTYNLMQTNKVITIIGPTGTKAFIETIANIFGIDPVLDKLRVLEVLPKEKNCVLVVEEKSFSIYAFRTEHGIPSLGYVFQEKDFQKFDEKKAQQYGIPPTRIRKRLLEGKPIEISGKLIQPSDVVIKIPGRKIVYTGDTRPIPYLEDIARGAELLIHEATFMGIHKNLADARYHSTIEDALEIAKKANVKMLALVHISPRYLRELDKIIDYIKNFSSSSNIKLIIPNDGDEIIIDPPNLPRY